MTLFLCFLSSVETWESEVCLPSDSVGSWPGGCVGAGKEATFGVGFSAWELLEEAGWCLRCMRRRGLSRFCGGTGLCMNSQKQSKPSLPSLLIVVRTLFTNRPFQPPYVFQHLRGHSAEFFLQVWIHVQCCGTTVTKMGPVSFFSVIFANCQSRVAGRESTLLSSYGPSFSVVKGGMWDIGE